MSRIGYHVRDVPLKGGLISRSFADRSRFAKRSTLACLVAALLGMSVLPVGAPEIAHAATPVCAPGDLCLWKDIGYAGGRYNWGRDDGDLTNDKFVGTSTIVAGEASSLWNNGIVDPSGYNDVQVNDGIWNRGSYHLCVPRTVKYSDLREQELEQLPPRDNWNDKIQSFKWVTSC